MKTKKQRKNDLPSASSHLTQTDKFAAKPIWRSTFTAFTPHTSNASPSVHSNALLAAVSALVHAASFDVHLAALRKIAHVLATARGAHDISQSEKDAVCVVIHSLVIPICSDAFFCCPEQASRTALLSIYSRVAEIDRLFTPTSSLGQALHSDFETNLLNFLASTADASQLANISLVCSVLLNTLEWSVGLAIFMRTLKDTFDSLVTLLSRVLVEIDAIGSARSGADTLSLSHKTRACYDLLRTLAALFAKLDASKFEFLRTDGDWSAGKSEDLLLKCIKVTFSDPKVYIRDCQFIGGIVTSWLLLSLYPTDAERHGWISALFGLGKLQVQKHAAVDKLKAAFESSLSNPDDLYSALCLLRGLLTTFGPKLAEIDVSPTVLGVIYTHIMAVIDSSSDSATRILAFQTLASWMSVVRDVLRKSERKTGPIDTAQLDSALKRSFDLVFTFWEDPVDSMQHKLKDVFNFMLEIIQTLRTKQGAGGGAGLPIAEGRVEQNAVLVEIVDSLLKADWLRKVKYDLLAQLLTIVRPDEILQLRPDFLVVCFEVIANFSMSSRICSFLLRFFSALFEDAKWSLDVANTGIWLNPICFALTHPSVNLRSAITDNFLTSVFNGKNDHYRLVLAALNKSRQMGVNSINPDAQSGSNGDSRINPKFHIHASICILRTGKTLGFLGSDFLSPSNPESVFNNHVITLAISHPDPNIRTDVCGLLCDSARALAEPTPEELHLIQQFLIVNGNDSVSEFRMRLFGNLHKLIVRMRKCLYANQRDLKTRETFLVKNGGNGDRAKVEDAERDVQNLNEKISAKMKFLQWLVDFAVLSLSPGSSFPRITSAMVLLTTIRDAEEISLDSTFHKNLGPEFNCFGASVTCARALTSILMHDTFEPSRLSAFGLLMSMKNSAAAGDGEIPGYGVTEVQTVLNEAIQMLHSVKSSDSDSGSLVLRLVYAKYATSSRKFTFNLSSDSAEINAKYEAPAAFVVQILSLLRKHVEIAEADLASSISSYPMHGVFSGLRCVLSEIDFSKVDLHVWNPILLDAYSLIYKATQAVLAILSNESPEGNYPGLNPEETGSKLGDTTADFDAVMGEAGGDQTSKSQRILHECFRTVKEACGALEAVLCKPPLPSDKEGNHILAYETIEQGGNWLRLLLTTIRHFGAFSGVFTCFQSLCSRLLCSNNALLAVLPQSWLADFLHQAEVMDVSITRRSGGLPLGVVAVLGAQSPYRGTMLEKTMDLLFKVAKRPVGAGIDTNLDLPQVHAYNIIRRLLLDATITDLMRNYFSSCFVLSIDGLSSESFPIRNCATMLFSALVTKVLGMKKSRDEYSAINTVTGREFFARFPVLHAFMMEKLAAAVQDLERGNRAVHPAFYPILTILARLKSSAMEGNNSHLTLSMFRPLVLKCAASSFFKVREITARAYASLIPSTEFVEQVSLILDELQSTRAALDYNRMHGLLMIVKQLVQVHLHREVAGKDVLSDFLAKAPKLVENSFWILNDRHIPAVQDVYLSILKTVLVDRKWLHSLDEATAFTLTAAPMLKQTWITSAKLLSQTKTLVIRTEQAWTYNLRQNLAQYCLGCLEYLAGANAEAKTEIVVSFLHDSDYEVQLQALSYLQHSSLASTLNWTRLVPILLSLVHSKESYEQLTYNAATVLSCPQVRPILATCDLSSVTSVVVSVSEDLAERLSMTDNTYEVAAVLPLLAALVADRVDGGGESGMGVLVRLMRKWIADETATYIRVSVAKALELILPKFSSQLDGYESIYVDLLILLEVLLDDDDVDVRTVAAELAAAHLDSKEPMLPTQCRCSILKRILERIQTPESFSRVAEYATRLLIGGVATETLLEAQLNPAHVLFAKEEANQHKEVLVDAVMAYQTLLTLIQLPAVSSDMKTAIYATLAKWLQDSIHALESRSSNLAELKGSGKVFGALVRIVVSGVHCLGEHYSDDQRLKARQLLKRLQTLDVHEQVKAMVQAESLLKLTDFLPCESASKVGSAIPRILTTLGPSDSVAPDEFAPEIEDVTLVLVPFRNGFVVLNAVVEKLTGEPASVCKEDIEEACDIVAEVAVGEAPVAVEIRSSVDDVGPLPALSLAPGHPPENQGTQVKTEEAKVFLAALVDMNGDTCTDLVGVSGASLVVYECAHRRVLDSAAGTTFTVRTPFAKTENLVAMDWDGDGCADVLAMGGQPVRSARKEDALGLAVLWRLKDAERNSTAMPEWQHLDPAAGLTQPFVVDLFGDMRPALLGYPQKDPDTLSVWRFHANRTVTLSPFTLFDTASNTAICKSPSVHSNAFIDLNGDCLADIFVTCYDPKTRRSFFQIWVNSRDNGFSLGLEHLMPADVHGPVTFADMDADGTMDIVFSSCDPANPRNCFIHVLFNTQIPLCTNSLPLLKGSNQNCRVSSDLCTADPSFEFKSNTLKLPLSEILPADAETLDVNAMPLRLGDFDNDGYPDILMLTNDRSKRYIRLLQSVPCTRFLCAKSDQKRAFKVVTTGMDELNNIPGTKTGAIFFDLFDDGTLDVLAFTQNEVSKLDRISAFKNNFFTDGFFLKSLVTNGVCPGWCPEGEKFPNPKPFGVNYPGATLKYTVTDTQGSKRAVQLAQLPQSSYFALNTPYTHAGLGRTNNYIEQLFVGATKQHSDNVASYFGVIPNSQLIIIPYEETGADGPSEWKLELFINPSSHAPWVFVSLLTTLVALTGIVIFLNVLERREDERERKTNLHNINFDAL
ncbi:hypothetical protein HDU81_000692 [Chytriomyces hyalinus]|nr:hypothetical protein HDU81_000692 [Chytriomyces hyalinus]